MLDITTLLKYIPSTPLLCTWDRGSADTLADYSYLSIFNANGHISVKSNPRIGFKYQIDGDDLIITPDSVVFEDVLSDGKACGSLSTFVNSPLVTDALLYYTLWTTIQEVASLVWPGCQTNLYQQSTFTIHTDGGIVIKFIKGNPTVKITELVTYNLTIEVIILTVKDITINYSGSMFKKQYKINLG